jgi:hypothetical protein
VRNRLSNSGDLEVMRVGNQLGQLHSQRIAESLRNWTMSNPTFSFDQPVLTKVEL